MTASKLAETWSQTENCIDDGGFLPRLARSWKIDYGEMVETRAVFKFAQFRKRHDVVHVTSMLSRIFRLLKSLESTSMLEYKTVKHTDAHITFLF